MAEIDYEKCYKALADIAIQRNWSDVTAEMATLETTHTKGPYSVDEVLAMVESGEQYSFVEYNEYRSRWEYLPRAIDGSNWLRISNMDNSFLFMNITDFGELYLMLPYQSF